MLFPKIAPEVCNSLDLLSCSYHETGSKLVNICLFLSSLDFSF